MWRLLDVRSSHAAIPPLTQWPLLQASWLAQDLLLSKLLQLPTFHGPCNSSPSFDRAANYKRRRLAGPELQPLQPYQLHEETCRRHLEEVNRPTTDHLRIIVIKAHHGNRMHGIEQHVTDEASVVAIRDTRDCRLRSPRISHEPPKQHTTLPRSP